MTELVIYKYRLLAAESQVLPLPDSAEVLTVQVQNGEPYLWVLLDPEAGVSGGREILSYATGQKFDANWLRYVGSFQLENGTLVFHVFQVAP